MKTLLNSRLAVFAASLAAGVVAWLTGKDIIAPDQAAQAAGELTTLLNAFFAALAAIGMWLFAIVLRKFTGGNSGGGNSGTGSSGGNFPCFALFTTLALSMAGFALTSCSSFSLTGDGCVRSTQTREGKTYAVDTCFSPDGKVDRVRLLWSNETARELRATIYRDDRPVFVEFRDLDTGFWYRWTEGMGISLGAVPPEVAAAMKSEPELPVIEVEK
jgi:hypothetical protein